MLEGGDIILSITAAPNYTGYRGPKYCHCWTCWPFFSDVSPNKCNAGYIKLKHLLSVLLGKRNTGPVQPPEDTPAGFLADMFNTRVALVFIHICSLRLQFSRWLWHLFCASMLDVYALVKLPYVEPWKWNQGTAFQLGHFNYTQVPPLRAFRLLLGLLFILPSLDLPPPKHRAPFFLHAFVHRYPLVGHFVSWKCHGVSHYDV